MHHGFSDLNYAIGSAVRSGYSSVSLPAAGGVRNSQSAMHLKMGALGQKPVM